MHINLFEDIRTYSHTKKYVAILLLTATLISGIGWYATRGMQDAPKLSIQQFNTIPDNRVYALKEGRPFTQTITMPSLWSVIAIRYISPAKKVKDMKVSLSLKQRDRLLSTIQTTTAPLENPGSLDGTDFFTNDSWLLFPLPSVGPDLTELSFTLEGKNGTLRLPYSNENSPKLNTVGLITTNWTQHLSFSLAQNNRIQRIVIALIAPIILLLMWQIIRLKAPRSMARISVLLLALFAILYTLPLFNNTTLWGQNDWTEVVAHFASARQTFEMGQFPLWNPYFCGGFPAWSNPQTYWPSLMLALSWVTNDIIGTKLAIMAYLALGLWGTYALCRSLRLSPLAAAAASLIYCGNGFIAMHLSIGHLLWLSMAWIPWAAYFFMKSVRQPWYLILSVGACLLILIEGQIYFFIYTCLFLGLFAIVWYWHTRTLAIINRLIFFCILTACLGAIKLVPTLYFLNSLHNHFGAGTYLPIQSAYTAFFERNLANVDAEYGAYIGIAAFLFFILGVARSMYAKNRLYGSLAGIALLFLLFACLPPELNILRFVPILADLRTQTRALIIVVFIVALLAAYGVQGVLRHVKNNNIRRLIGIAFIAWLALDYTIVANTAIHQLFSEPAAGAPSNEGYQQTEGRRDTTYNLIAAERGNINYCPPHMRLWQPKQSLIARSSPQYKGEAYTDHNSPVTLTRFTPNQITIQIGAITQIDTVHINQNYDKGWYSNQVSLTPIYTHLSFPITPQDSNQTVYVQYIPQGFVLGVLITLISILALGIYYIIFRRYANSHA